MYSCMTITASRELSGHVSFADLQIRSNISKRCEIIFKIVEMFVAGMASANQLIYMDVIDAVLWSYITRMTV